MTRAVWTCSAFSGGSGPGDLGVARGEENALLAVDVGPGGEAIGELERSGRLARVRQREHELGLATVVGLADLRQFLSDLERRLVHPPASSALLLQVSEVAQAIQRHAQVATEQDVARLAVDQILASVPAVLEVAAGGGQVAAAES